MLNWFILIALFFGAAALVNVQPVNAPPSVHFDRDIYYPGDTVIISVLESQYAGLRELIGTNILVLYDKDGAIIAAWDRIESQPDRPGVFTVTCVLPATIKLGKICAKYTDPYNPHRGAVACVTVSTWCGYVTVKNIVPNPNPFSNSTTFIIQSVPTDITVPKIFISIYDLTGSKVDEISGINTAAVTWNGKNLRNGAYIYIAVVEGIGKSFGPFKGFVYIER